jgi:hypothetical protein
MLQVALCELLNIRVQRGEVLLADDADLVDEMFEQIQRLVD